MASNDLLAGVAVLLFFFLPGFFLMRALWPEWRFQGPKALERLLTSLVGAFVLSLVLTILVGFVLGNIGLFAAGPSDPFLEEILAALSLVFLATGWWLGAYAREPPPASPWAKEPLFGEADSDEYMAQMEAMAKEERRLRHAVRVSRKESPVAAVRVQKELDGLLQRRREIELEREERLTS